MTAASAIRKSGLICFLEILERSFQNNGSVERRKMGVRKFIPTVASHMLLYANVFFINILFTANTNIPKMAIATDLLKKEWILNFSSKLTKIPAIKITTNKKN